MYRRERIVRADGTSRIAAHSLAQIPRSDDGQQFGQGDAAADPLARPDHEEQEQPLVLHVPEGELVGSGLTSLYLGAITAQVEGLSADESSELMEALMAHCVDGGVYSHVHEEGVVLLADNRTCIHRSTNYGDMQGRASGYPRHVVRIQAEETQPLETFRWQGVPSVAHSAL
jgi:alpha-ketoglutarate-dependent taurine dioxygenase